MYTLCKLSFEIQTIAAGVLHFVKGSSRPFTFSQIRIYSSRKYDDYNFLPFKKAVEYVKIAKYRFVTKMTVTTYMQCCWTVVMEGAASSIAIQAYLTRSDTQQ